MAKVIQIIPSGEINKHFEPDLIDGLWHVVVATAGPRTLCGIQLDGDDGIMGGEEQVGRVTCQTCRNLIKEVKAIRNW